MPTPESLQTDSATAPRVVLCFDRDRTVDVHPPEHNDAVPLEWVQYFAHHEDTHEIDVWATGNQHLRSEAGIPGLRNAINVWQTHYDTDVYEDFPRPSVETYKPYRRNGLNLVKTLYECAFPEADIEFVVVDDEEMHDLETDGWNYYLPWEFVDAIENRTAPVTVPDDTGVFTSESLESKNATYDVPPLNDSHPFVTLEAVGSE